MTGSETDTTYFRELIRFDWLVTRAWNRLHFADLTDEQLAEMEENGLLDGPVELSCGRIAAAVSIPGVITRICRERCTGCCRALGYPPGTGSPKNDDACRELLGLAAKS